MKKKLVLLFIFLIGINAQAITLGDYEKKLQEYKNEVYRKQQEINKKNHDIDKAQRNISTIKENIADGVKTIGKLHEEIENNKQEIVKKKGEISRVLAYYQISQTYNPEMDYIFKAKTTKDLIYRYEVVNQVIDYNKQTIQTLTDIIEDNKVKEKNIKKEEKILNQNQKNLEERVVELGEEKSAISDAAMSVQEQIRSYEKLVQSYKKLGCKSHHRIGIDCAVSGSAGIFRRPTVSGYITSGFGPRAGGFHQGIDIGNRKNPTIEIYSVANGRITSVYTDVYGAKCVVAEYKTGGKYYSAFYCHLSEFGNVWVGKHVTSNTVIGYMGNTGFSFGHHLHLEITPCRYLNWGDQNCSSWSRYANFVRTQYNRGYKGPRSLISFPKNNVWWYSR